MRPAKKLNVTLDVDGKDTDGRDPGHHPATLPNSESLDDVLSRNRAQLYATALRLMGNHHDAEDAVQDGLLAAHRKLDTFENRSQLSTWLTRIVVNAALMRLRQNRLRPTISIDENFDQNVQPLSVMLPDPKPNPEEICAGREQLRLAERALQAMPELHRRVVWLYYIQGFKVREAAEIVGIPTGALKSKLHRTRLRLCEQLSHGHSGMGMPQSK